MAARKKVIDVPRFCTVSDDSGHDYFVPVERKDDWYAWAYGPESAYEDLPKYATRIDGRFTFTDPRCD